jgi:hypothetical protein
LPRQAIDNFCDSELRDRLECLGGPVFEHDHFDKHLAPVVHSTDDLGDGGMTEHHLGGDGSLNPKPGSHGRPAPQSIAAKLAYMARPTDWLFSG